MLIGHPRGLLRRHWSHFGRQWCICCQCWRCLPDSHQLMLLALVALYATSLQAPMLACPTNLGKRTRASNVLGPRVKFSNRLDAMAPPFLLAVFATCTVAASIQQPLIQRDYGIPLLAFPAFVSSLFRSMSEATGSNESSSKTGCTMVPLWASGRSKDRCSTP